jgi:hypothetical protein
VSWVLDAGRTACEDHPARGTACEGKLLAPHLRLQIPHLPGNEPVARGLVEESGLGGSEDALRAIRVGNGGPGQIGDADGAVWQRTLNVTAREMIRFGSCARRRLVP